MHIKQITVALLLVVICLTSYALPDDREQPTNVKADTAETDQQTGTTILIGAVEIEQGSLRIEADKATIYYEGSQISKIICVGNPAHFQQQMNPEQGLVIGKANLIDYDQQSNLLKLREKANVIQADGSTLTSYSIDYGLIDETMNADGQVHIVIPPNQNPGEKDGNP